jgi:hypothetical protein
MARVLFRLFVFAFFVSSRLPLAEGQSRPFVAWISDSTITKGRFNDEGFVEILERSGYRVERISNLGDGDALSVKEINYLNSADVAVISRDTRSSGYHDKVGWQKVTTPLVVMNPFLVRSSRWAWFSSDKIFIDPHRSTPRQFIGPELPFKYSVEATPSKTVKGHSIGDEASLLLRKVSTSPLYQYFKTVPPHRFSPRFVMWKGSIADDTTQSVIWSSKGYKIYLDGGLHGKSDSAEIGTYNLLPEGEELFLGIVRYALFAKRGYDFSELFSGITPCSAQEIRAWKAASTLPSFEVAQDTEASFLEKESFKASTLDWLVLLNSILSARASSGSLDALPLLSAIVNYPWPLSEGSLFSGGITPPRQSLTPADYWITLRRALDGRNDLTSLGCSKKGSRTSLTAVLSQVGRE